MKTSAAKLWAAGTALLVALVLLVGASMAWFTISTNPEISGISLSLYTNSAVLLSADGVNYSGNLDLSGAFTGMAPLHPVSTVDGVNWFLPTYNAKNGDLNDPSEFILDDDLEYANVMMLDAKGNTLTGQDYINNLNRGYYVYADVWLKTGEDATDIRLSVPSTYSQMEDWESEQGMYGTYVLCNYTTEKKKTEDGSIQTVAMLDRRAQSCLRVGFLLDPDNPDSDYYRDFTIYEPNSDSRSDAVKPGSVAYTHTALYTPDDSTTYVNDYVFDEEEYVEGNYFFTRPIKLGDDGKGQTTDIITTGAITVSGSSINTKLIVQKTSNWAENTDFTRFFKSDGQGGGYFVLNSNAVGKFGRFLDTEELRDKAVNGTTYAAIETSPAAIETTPGAIDTTSAAITIMPPTIGLDGFLHAMSIDDYRLAESIVGNDVIVRLMKDTPVRVRIFIWIEGQDVDCWNDIATGSIVVNLELGAETINLAPASESQ